MNETKLPPCTSYAGARIGNVKEEYIPRIVHIVDSYNDTLQVSTEDMRWLMRIFIDDIRVTHMELDISCRTCRMKTLNCFIGYVYYWREHNII